MLRSNASDQLSPQLLKVVDDAKWSKTHFMYTPPSPADVEHAEHFLSVQREHITYATKYQISVLELRHRDKIEKLKHCLKLVQCITFLRLGHCMIAFYSL